MLQRLVFLVLLSYMAAVCALQAQAPAYFQQQVNTTIRVTLNDSLHTLTGDIAMEYINNSPHTLDTIWMHLWGNAYKNKTTAFAEQQLAQGSTKFYFAEAADMGRYKGIEFAVNGQKAEWKTQRNNPDIAWVKLPAPLRPGESVTLSTPFTLKIPASFSRLGHVGTSYQLTQWFPKPAVFDHKGWHAMPYLDMGEFYSEFGTYDVTITLPSNYVVAATGVLQTPAEIDFLKSREAYTRQVIADKQFGKTDSFPPSATTLKTIRYTAENVHDFAWFADKRFYVMQDVATLSSGKRIDTYTFFTNVEADLWKDAIAYVNRAVQSYSTWVGSYPYPQATAVQSALSAGGGMEYPMITVIGKTGDATSLDEVITHEVGHNWFYGILASNERDHPWMDEGMNSFYEQRYMKTFYGKNRYEKMLGRLSGKNNLPFDQLFYLFQARRRQDQAPDTHSAEFSNLNYGLSAYQKPAAAFALLENYLGYEAFNNAIQSYYDTWKFRHPYPEDLRQHLETTTGKNLGWLFDGLINSTKKTDYSIAHVAKGDDYAVTVRNRGEVASPFSLTGFEGGKPVHTQWYNGSDTTKVVTFKAGNYERLVVDAGYHTFDLHRHNNSYFLNKKMPKCLPLKWKPIGIENPNYRSIYALPIVAWNDYDKWQLGAVVHNISILEKPFEYFFAPMYAFGSRELTGIADINQKFYPRKGRFQRITVGVGAKTFNFDYNQRFDYHQKYYRVAPYVRIDLKTAPAKGWQHSFMYRPVFYGEQEASFGTFDTVTQSVPFTGTYWNTYLAHQLVYEGALQTAPAPMSWNVTLTQQGRDNTFSEKEKAFDNYLNKRINYVRLAAEHRMKVYYETKRAVDIRSFVGVFLGNTERNAGYITPSAFAVAHHGPNDFLYQDYYFGRSERGTDTQAPGLWNRQLSLREGGFKTPFDPRFVNQFGHSNSYLLAMNLSADLPLRLPWNPKPYADLAYYGNRNFSAGEGENPIKGVFVWDIGLQVSPLRDIFTIYFPLFNADIIGNRFSEIEQTVKPFLGTKYWNRISFFINFNALRRDELVKRINM